MRLDAWGNAWIVHEFDPRTRTSRRSLSWPRRDAGQELRGWATYLRTEEHGRTLVALYVHAGSVWLSVGGEAIDLDHGAISAEHSTVDGRCVFVLHHPGGSLRCTYRDPTRPWASLDPAYDELDRESDDFLYFAASTVANPRWRAEMVSAVST